MSKATKLVAKVGTQMKGAGGDISQNALFGKNSLLRTFPTIRTELSKEKANYRKSW